MYVWGVEGVEGGKDRKKQRHICKVILWALWATLNVPTDRSLGLG